MNKLTWARDELRRAGYSTDDPEDGPDKWIAENVIQLLQVFSEQGHSGSSAPFAIRIFEQLASWKPLTPLTGNDEEWQHFDNESISQNIRDSSVFKNIDGVAYWTEGKVFWEWFSYEGGEPYKSYFTNSESSVDVAFPWSRPDSPQYVFKPNSTYPNEER